jgi:hypothetical protein
MDTTSSRTEIWVRHVAYVGEIRNIYKTVIENLKEIHNLKNPCVVGRIKLEWIVSKLKGCGLDLSGPALESVVGSCKHENKHCFHKIPKISWLSDRPPVLWGWYIQYEKLYQFFLSAEVSGSHQVILLPQGNFNIFLNSAVHKTYNYRAFFAWGERIMSWSYLYVCQLGGFSSRTTGRIKIKFGMDVVPLRTTSESHIWISCEQ